MGLVEDGLLPEDVREADDSTGANDGTGNRAAAIGQWSNWLLHIGEVGVSPKASVVDADGAVDAGVKLVLVVGIVCGATIVVGRCGEVGGCRKAGEQCSGGRIEWRSNDVVGKLLAEVDPADDGRGGRVVDVRDAGKDALALIDRGDRRDDGTADEGLDALVVAEEEEVIVQDRRTERGAVEVATVLGLAWVGRGGG